MTTHSRLTTFSVCTLLAGFCSIACNLADDEPYDPGETEGTDGTDGGAAGCFEAAANQCLPQQEFIGIFEEGDADVVLIDDPQASVGVGPNAWLVSVQSSADWVGSYMYDGGTCTVGCGWCQEGQSLCHGGFDGNMLPNCYTCLPPDTEDIGEQCATFVAAACTAPSDDDGGLDETGDDGLDETGDDGLDETTGPQDYDCAGWDPAGAVDLAPVRGTFVVDAGVVQEIASYFGEPLADCDDTKFGQTADGHFAIRRMASGGMLAQLGLRPGDTIVALDGKDMADVDTIANTAVSLFLGETMTTGFTLTYRRGRSKSQLRILVR